MKQKEAKHQAEGIQVNKINWEHHVTRRVAVQIAIAWNLAYGRMFEKRYRTGIRNTLVYFDGKKTDYFVDKDHHKQFNIDLDTFLSNPDFIIGLIPEAKEFLEDTYLHIKSMIGNARELSDKDLAELYSGLSSNHANYYTRMWMVFRICESIVRKIESMMMKKLNDKGKVKELSRIFSIPLKPNDVTNERIDLLKIAIKSNMFSRNILLEKHARKYRHIPMFDFDHDPYNYEHFNEQLKQIKNPKKELRKILSSFKQRRNMFDRKLAELEPGNQLFNLIMMLKKAVVLRDYRDMIRQKQNLALRSFYKEIGSRIGLNVKEAALLTNDEIRNHLYNSKKFPRAEIEKRKKAFLLIQLDEKIEIYSGEEAHEAAKNQSICTRQKKSSKIKGIVGSPGKAAGTAKVVYTNKDLTKIKKGDIMVATMTRQDFVPAMRRASGIITNEGGVTCHAAIIARELGLPCIVGTGNATEMINDGDIISIDQDKVKFT